MELSFSFHAKQRMKTRGITVSEIKQTLERPDLKRPGKPGKTVFERRFGDNVCVVAVDGTNPVVIVTVWRR